MDIPVERVSHRYTDKSQFSKNYKDSYEGRNSIAYEIQDELEKKEQGDEIRKNLEKYNTGVYSNYRSHNNY